MTAQELRSHFNDTFGLGEWPETYEVDHETYANACHFVFKQKLEYDKMYNRFLLSVTVGSNKGLMFKNVELILKEDE